MEGTFVGVATFGSFATVTLGFDAPVEKTLN